MDRATTILRDIIAPHLQACAALRHPVGQSCATRGGLSQKPPRNIDKFTQEYLCARFDYNARTGELLWRALPNPTGWQKGFNTNFAGRPALTKKHSRGYRQGLLDQTNVMAHQVIWKMVTGVSPNEVDHINGITSDNRFANLRNIDHKTNGRNIRRRTPRTLPVGVREKGQRFVACIGHGDNFKRLGAFATVEAASEAYRQEAQRRGYHPDHGTDAHLLTAPSPSPKKARGRSENVNMRRSAQSHSSFHIGPDSRESA